MLHFVCCCFVLFCLLKKKVNDHERCQAVSLLGNIVKIGKIGNLGNINQWLEEQMELFVCIQYNKLNSILV